MRSLGAVTYKVKENQATMVTDNFVADQVALGIQAVMGRNLAVLFGRALFWAAIECSDRVPTRLREAILSRLVSAGGDAATNPIERVPIVVTGPSGRLTVVEVGRGGRRYNTEYKQKQYSSTNGGNQRKLFDT